MKVNITTIGGGTGTFNVLYGLKKNKNYNLAAIVSVSDSGGSTGEIRDQFGILPPGDIRRAIVALSEDTGIVRKLFEYRFKAGNRMSGHTIGNLLLTALTDITGTFEKGIQELSEMFQVRGKVIPVTLDDTQLGITLEDGTQIIGETNIDIPKHDANQGIRDAFLVGGGKLNPRAREVLVNSDYIVIGPGDLYTSIVPNLLATGMREAIQESTAKIIYICNIMTKYGETNNFQVEDFVNVIEKYIGKNEIDYVLVNNAPIGEELVLKYKQEENKQPVRITDISLFSSAPYKIIERDVVNENDYIRHDPEKLAGVIADFVEGWIK
ncbi:MAG: YvcK family protein [Candidatus Gracilibacteria bacterium]|nr:YvcK family protein [Candidatus Gracilibacteria bacterium]